MTALRRVNVGCLVQTAKALTRGQRVRYQLTTHPPPTRRRPGTVRPRTEHGTISEVRSARCTNTSGTPGIVGPRYLSRVEGGNQADPTGAALIDKRPVGGPTQGAVQVLGNDRARGSNSPRGDGDTGISRGTRGNQVIGRGRANW